MANAAVVLAGLVFFLASVGARAHILLDWPSLRTGLDTFFQLAAFGAFLVLLMRRPLWAITVGLTYLLLLTNAFWSLYWPSLRPGIPVQDFLLANEVSANYSWDQVRIYVGTSATMLVLGLAARVSWPRASPVVRMVFGTCVFSAIGMNVLVVAVQGQIDLTFLSASSGSALAAERAPGLLEDSGAATVYAAAALSGGLFAALFAQGPGRWRLLWAGLTLLGGFAAASTGGRIYFLSIAASAAVGLALVAFGALRLVRPRTWLVAAVALVVLEGSISLLALQSEFLVKALTDPVRTANDAVVGFDVVRSVHVKVMLRAFVEHPWFGTGFGSFYANFWYYLGWALLSGGSVYADVPGSMYPMLLSELGVAGGLMIAAGLIWVAARLVRLTRPADGDGPDLWTAFAAGASVSLAVSFLVGIHIIFWSVPALAIPIAIGGASESAPARRWFAPVWGAALLVIAIACAQLWATAPRAPEFRWKERGTPQIPVSLVVPVWPAGLEGIWASSGAEFLFEGKPLWFHIERPAEFYPMTFTIQVFDRGGRPVATYEEVFEAPTGADPGRLIQVSFDNDVNSLCATDITPDDYCSFRITTTPEWTLDKQPVAVLYVTRNLR